MGSRFTASVVLVALAPWPAFGQEAGGLKIEHTPAACFTPGEYPEIHARIAPITSVVKAEVQFRGDPAAAPHVAPMRQVGDEFVAVLPKPTGNPLLVSYRIEATDPNLLAVSSDEAQMLVTTCSNPAPTTKTPRLEVRAPQGAAAVPAGFTEENVVAEGTPEERHPGVFNLGETGSLIAALSVGAVAAGIGILTNNEKVPPARDPDFEEPGVRFIDSSPAPGSSVTIGALRITIRAVSSQLSFGVPRMELRQTAGGPVCAVSPLRGSVQLVPNIGQNVSFVNLGSTGACGSSYEVNEVRVVFTSISGVPLFGTGLGGLPDLQLRYNVTD